MEHQNRARDLFKPLEAGAVAALGALLIPGVVIEMHMPIDASTGRKMREVRALHSALIDHVRSQRRRFRSADTPIIVAR